MYINTEIDFTYYKSDSNIIYLLSLHFLKSIFAS